MLEKRDWQGVEECIAKQSEIIELQRVIIDGLSACLLQHIAADDMPYLKEIHRAAELYQEL